LCTRSRICVERVTNYHYELVTDGPRPHIAPRTFQRRRLAVLAGVLAVVLVASAFVEAADRPEVVATAAAEPDDDQRVRIAALGTPTAVRELLSQTTTTLIEATGATTVLTAEPVVPETIAPTTTTPAPATTAAPAPTSAPSSTTSSTAAPTSTTAPSAAPPPTAAPTTTAPPRTTTTTTAPPSSAGDGGEGYAYDDPRSTQVWYDLAGCESGGNWSTDSGNGYYGGLQFALASWESVGGTGYPHEHPAATQIDFGRKLQARQGWEAWPHCSEKLGLR
jgi:hypothetical protein